MASGEGSYFSDVQLGGSHARVFTKAIEPGLAIQAAQTVDEQDQAIDRLAVILALVGIGGVGLAGGLGLVVTRTATRPVRELSAAAEHVAKTRDLSRRIEASGADELSGLATSFNTMLEALDRSMRAQRQLVSDASHELRTPLTSLRTNVEVLAGSNGALPLEERKRMLQAVAGQLDELTGLVGDLVDLARDGERDELLEPVRLDLLVSDAVARARRLHPGREINLHTEETLVDGSPAPVQRATGSPARRTASTCTGSRRHSSSPRAARGSAQRGARPRAPEPSARPSSAGSRRTPTRPGAADRLDPKAAAVLVDVAAHLGRSGSSSLAKKQRRDPWLGPPPAVSSDPADGVPAPAGQAQRGTLGLEVRHPLYLVGVGCGIGVMRGVERRVLAV